MSDTLDDSLKKKVSRSKSLSSFLLELDKNPKILRHQDLNYFIYHLKEYYNSLLLTKSENKREIDCLKFQEKKYECLIKGRGQELINDNQDIDSIIYKDNIELVKIKYENLKRRKAELSQKLEKEIENHLIITNQLKNERKNMNYYNDLEIQLKEKLSRLATLINNLDSNLNERSKKSRNFIKINEEINKKIITMNSLISLQNTKCEEISGNLKDQKTQLIKEKELIKKNLNMLEKDTVKKKNQYKDLFRSVELLKNNKLERENKVIKTVLGLDLIKRFFIDRFQEDKEESSKLLYESEEFKSFKNLKLTTQENTNNTTLKKKSSMPNFSLNKISSIVFVDDDKSKINCMEIKKKFDSINVDFNQIIDFHSKVLNKRHFNHNLIMKFNLKQINLESLKEKYSRKVSFIVNKNYKNIEEIMKNDYRIKSLMKKFAYCKDDPKQENLLYLFEDLSNNKNEDFYEKCLKLIEIIKSFLDIFSSMIENDIDDNTTEFKLISEKIKEYFDFLSLIYTKSKDNYITSLFQYLEETIGKNLDNVSFQKDYLIGKEINDSNYLKMFAYLKLFYLKNKHVFLSVKLNYKEYIANALNIEKIEEILEMIQNVLYRSNTSPKCLISPIVESSKKDIIVKTKKKSNVKISTSEVIKVVSPRKEEDENEENSNSINEEMFPKVYSNKMNVKKLGKVNGRLEKLLKPFEIKNKYFTKFNENLLSIKKDTKSSIRDNFSLTKKQDEIGKISKEMILYNNPNLNLDNLSNNTYNNFVKKIINTYNDMNIINNNNDHRERKLNRNYSNPNFSKK